MLNNLHRRVFDFRTMDPSLILGGYLRGRIFRNRRLYDLDHRLPMALDPPVMTAAAFLRSR